MISIRLCCVCWGPKDAFQAVLSAEAEQTQAMPNDDGPGDGHPNGHVSDGEPHDSDDDGDQPNEPPASPAYAEPAGPPPPPSPATAFRFEEGQRPSCPHVEWDSQVDESQRPDGLTPEADAWNAFQKSLKDAMDDHKSCDSVPSTVPDRSEAENDVVCISDAEDPIPRDLYPVLDAVAERQEKEQDMSVAGLPVKKKKK